VPSVFFRQGNVGCQPVWGEFSAFLVLVPKITIDVLQRSVMKNKFFIFN